MSLLGIFASAILPIVALSAVGFVLARRTGVVAGPLNTVTVYVLVPALVFHSIATTDLSGSTLVGIAAGVLVFTGVMVLLAEGVGHGLGEAEPLLGSFVLVVTFANSGNLGIPVSEFAFGAVGRQTAVVYMAAQAVAMYTLGVYVAARGDGSSALEGLRTVFSIPLVYAVAGALLVRWLDLVPAAGSTARETLRLVGESAIPVMLLVLGIELATTDYGTALRRVAPATVLKLVVAPLVALGIVLVVGFENATVARVFVLECSMPAAVTTLILTGEFSSDADGGLEAAEYAGTAILVTTLLSVPLLTGLIALLRSGVVV